MTTPSVGRVVHYVSSQGDCQAAIVTEVGEVNKVGLAVFTPYMMDVRPLSLNGVDYNESPAARATWHWPERV